VRLSVRQQTQAITRLPYDYPTTTTRLPHRYHTAAGFYSLGINKNLRESQIGRERLPFAYASARSNVLKTRSISESSMEICNGLAT
jgi:hypothetical protein